MGTFYGSIHVRSTDLEGIKRSLHMLHEKAQGRFLLSPSLRGWIGVFPNQHGADFAVSEFIAKECAVPLLHCVVHDDDVFAYRLYDAGALCDEYSSNPACWDDTVDPATPPSGGQVELLETVLALRGKTERLRRLLSACHTEFTFEQERLRQFAELIGIPNACTAYEYLQDGERDGIVGWREFVHVPDLTAEKAAKRAATARVRAELKALQRDRVLVRELKHSFWCVDPSTSDLLLTMPREMLGAPKPVRLFLLQKPWTGEPTDTGLDLPGTSSRLAVSPSGRWLAIGHGFGRWAAELWDRQTGKRVLELEHKRAVSTVSFSSDEEWLVSRSENEVFITSVRERRRVQVFDAGNYGNAAALHPRTGYLVADARDVWQATYLDKPGVVQRLRRAPYDFDALSSQFFHAQLQFTRLLADETLLAEAGREKVEAARPAWRALGAELNEFAGHVFQLRFTADGNFLLCGTSEGLLVFETEKLTAAHDRMPRARFSFGLQRGFPAVPGPLGVGGSPYIYSFFEDVERARVLFGGIQGPIYYLHLADGSSGELIRPPEANRLWNITLTPDRGALACGTLPPIEQKTGKAKTQIWNYEALCRMRELPY